MSGISNYILNQKINALLGLTSGLPSVIDLDTTLTTGNNAGSNDIDMNNQDILNVDNIDLTTINGSAYPPVVATPNLQTVLAAGNSAGSNNINMNGQDIINADDVDLNTINGSPYPPVTPAWTPFAPRVFQPATPLAVSFSDCAYFVNGSLVIARYNLRMNDFGTLGNSIRIQLPAKTNMYPTTGQNGANCIGSVSFFDPNQQYDSIYQYSLTASCVGGAPATDFFIGGSNDIGLSWFGQFPQVQIVPNTFISATITYELG
jgi:hypothetical protein